MEFHLPHILAFLALALVVSHAALPPERYWNSILPNTPMPKAVRDLLHPELVEDKSTSVVVGKGGLNVNVGKGKPGGTTVNVGKSGANVNSGKRQSGGGTHVSVGGKGVGVGAGKPGKGFRGTKVGVGKDGVSMSTGHKGRPVYVGFERNLVGYGPYRATENQLHADPNVAVFFLEKYMHPGKMMNLQFTENANKETFIPRQVADSIPFSSNKLPEIYSKFSVKPGSVGAEVIKDTIKECESPGFKGEERYCATSLESMIDFSTSKLGKNCQAISTEVENQPQMQKYTIKTGVKEMAGNKAVLCHKQNYPYAVFYCHATQNARTYTVPLEGADGTKAKAVAVCHTDTSAWNPKHLAFKVLNVKPGTVPVCHFLPQDHVVWVQN